MVRYKMWLYSALSVAGVVLLFAVFIAVRNDAALIGALSAAGAVAAAAFAAMAAFGSVRAATASSASAARAGEALARSVRPILEPSMATADGTVTASLTCTGYAAIDLNAVWTLTGGDVISDYVARLAPGDDPFTSTVTPDSTEPAQELEMVWLDYWDEGRVGRWQDTWQMGTEPHNKGRLTLLQSRLMA